MASTTSKATNGLPQQTGSRSMRERQDTKYIFSDCKKQVNYILICSHLKFPDMTLQQCYFMLGQFREFMGSGKMQ